MQHSVDIQAFLSDADRLVGHVTARLKECLPQTNAPLAPEDTAAPSCVLLLLGPQFSPNGGPYRPCLILNKRSERVRQPGDLCCPGAA